jgi:hypothetical protein
MSTEPKERMVLGPQAFECGIQKRLLYAGKSQVDYVDGIKVRNLTRISLIHTTK